MSAHVPFWEICSMTTTHASFLGDVTRTTYWARLKAANGKIVHVTETYPEKRLARKAIAVIEKAYQRELGFVEVRDLTAKAKP